MEDLFDNYPTDNPKDGQQHMSFGLTLHYQKNLDQAARDLVHSRETADKPAKDIKQKAVQLSGEPAIIITGQLPDEEGEDYQNWIFLLVTHQGKLYLLRSPANTSDASYIINSIHFI